MASEIKVNKISPGSGTALTVGDSGDTITIPTGAGLTVTDEIKTNKVSPGSGTALQIGDSGDTITVPSGATLTTTNATLNLPTTITSTTEVKTNKVSPATGTAFTMGDSGDTFTVPSGATLSIAGNITNTGTATGFSESLDWQTGDIKTATFTAVAGKGYFCNTTGGAFNFTLPASPTAGDFTAFKDYAETFATNNLTIDVNGNNLNGGDDTNPVISENGSTIVLMYVDATRGWIPIQDDTSTITGVLPYVVATGGTITTSGDFKQFRNFSSNKCW